MFFLTHTTHLNLKREKEEGGESPYLNSNRAFRVKDQEEDKKSQKMAVVSFTK